MLGPASHNEFVAGWQSFDQKPQLKFNTNIAEPTVPVPRAIIPTSFYKSCWIVRLFTAYHFVLCLPFDKMRYPSVLNICLLSLSVAALPADLVRRQDIDFALADSLPDPNLTVSSQYNEASAISAIIADIDENPLPQKRGIVRRGISGYSSITVGNAAINAPLNCIGGDTYMGSKLWNDQFFDETRCAAACTAQSVYNVKHPPSKGSPKTCQFYNTYVLSKNDVVQGQYW